MALQNIFTPESTAESLERLNKITKDTVPQWGKMNAPQMLAHLNVAYGITYGDIPVNNGWFDRMIIKLFVKNAVVSEKPYPKNGRTAPVFVINDERDFETEKAKLIAYIKKTQELGSAHFDGKKSPTLGVLTVDEWCNLFYKHMDHHFKQFGV